MILLFDETEKGITLERVIDPASYIDKKMNSIRRCKDNDKLIYCYLAGIQDPPKIGDRLQKKSQVFKIGSQITRRDGVIGEVVRIKKTKQDTEDNEDNEIITQYSVQWHNGNGDGNGTKTTYSSEHNFVENLKPVVGRIVGISRACRKLSECVKKGEQIRHKIDEDTIIIGTYVGDNKIQYGDSLMSLNEFSKHHYVELNRSTSFSNGWKSSEIIRAGEWISMERLMGTTILGYAVQWENASTPEEYSERGLETDTIQLSNAFANDLSQLSNDEIREKIDKQFRLIRYLIAKGPDEKDVLINLYQYIKDNMDKIKHRLKTRIALAFFSKHRLLRLRIGKNITPIEKRKQSVVHILLVILNPRVIMALRTLPVHSQKQPAYIPGDQMRFAFPIKIKLGSRPHLRIHSIRRKNLFHHHIVRLVRK